MKSFLLAGVLAVSTLGFSSSTANADCYGGSCSVQNAPVVGQPIRNVGRLFMNNKPVRRTVRGVLRVRPVRTLLRVRPVRSLLRPVVMRRSRCM